MSEQAIARNISGLTGALAASLACGVVIASGRPVLALAALLLAAGLLLVRRPGVVLALVLGSIILVEGDRQGFLADGARFYDGLAGPLLPTDLLLLLLVVSVVVDLRTRGLEVRTAGTLTLPLVLLATSVAIGSVTGYLDGGSVNDIVDSVRVLAYLVVTPFLVVNVVRSQEGVRRVLIASGLFAVFKGVEGTAAWVAGEGRPFGGTTLTYYEPATNLLMLVFLLTVAAAVLARAPLPRWALWGSLPVIAALALSFRRSFWIAAVLGLLLVLVLSRGSAPKLLFLAVASVVAALALAVSHGGATVNETNGGVVERARSLRPAQIRSTTEDRYRLVEQRNVIASLREHPITGLGIGVPWEVRDPLPERHEDDTLYTHVIVLWYWLKLGLAGLISYLLLMAVAIRSSYRISLLHRDPLIASAGLGLVAAFCGLAVVETTGSFTGVSLRFTLVFAAILGTIATAERGLQRTAST
jgi:O-antigen ligase